MKAKQLSMQDLFRKSKQEWLDEARATARKLLVNRPTITIDDATKICPRPDYVHQNTVGSVFDHPDFKATGEHVKSKRLLSKGRWIMVWRLTDQLYLYELPRNRRMFRQRVERTVE